LPEASDDGRLTAHRFHKAAQGARVQVGLAFHLGDRHPVDAERGRDLLPGEIERPPQRWRCC